MNKLATGFAVIATLSSTAPASYGNQTNEPDVLLDEITVTASSEPVSLQSTGSTVDIVEVEERIAPSLTFSGLLNKVPGINFSAAGGIGTETSVRVRGLPSYYLGTRIDGISVADPSRPQLSFNFGPLTASGIQRIEVLKGSQSALYGSETAAGLIDITSWRPEKTGQSGKINAETGTQGTASASVSAGFKNDQSEIAFTFGRTITDGISARSTDTTGEADAYRGTQVNFSARHELNQGISIGVFALSQQSYTEFDETALSTDGWTTDDAEGVRLFAEIENEQSSHSISASQFSTDRVYFQYGDYTYYYGDRRLLEYKGNIEVTENISLGVFAENKVEDFRFFLDYIDFSSGDLVVVNETGNVTTNAIGGEARWSPNAQADVSLTLRRDNHSLFGNQDSSRLAASWRSNENLTIRGAAALGYRSPSPYELWSSYGDESLMPEEIRSIELGAEFTSEDLSFQATAFESIVKNQVIFDDIESVYRQFSGDTRTRGLELTAEYYVASGWTAFGSYSYTTVTVSDELGTRRGVRTPRHQITVGVEGSISGKLSGSVSATQVRDLWDETYLYDYSENATIPVQVSQERLPDYITANVALSYELTDSANAYLRIENALDRKYETIKGFSQPGRTLFVGVQSNF